MKYIIQNGMVVDGSGREPYRADVSLVDGKIKEIQGHIQVEKNSDWQVIDAQGAYVTPGFIDIHRHADEAVFRPGFGELELRQGLTTIVNGNCGLSAVPITPEYQEDIEKFLMPTTGPFERYSYDMGSYRKAVEQTKPIIHTGMLVGTGTLKAAVQGYGNLRWTKEARRCAQKMLLESLDAGARGISMGLQYAPECFEQKNDIVQFLSPVKGRKIPLIVHVRGESNLVYESIEEAISIGEQLELPVHISHTKCIGKPNWGWGSQKIIEIMEAARARGLDVTCDAYPYTAGSIQFIQILPPEYVDGGMEGLVKTLQNATKRKQLTQILSNPSDDFDNLVYLLGWDHIILSSFRSPQNQKYAGLTVAELANQRGEDPYEMVYDLLIQEHGEITMIDQYASEEDVRRILTWEHCSIISDSLYPVNGVPHPRLYGNFPRVLETYVKEEKVLTIEEAVRKMTSMPAKVCGYHKKGLLQPGMDADVLVFQLDGIRCNATFENPAVLSSGFDYIFVDGRLRLQDDRIVE